MSKGTRPTQVRLNPSELERVERLKARFGIRTTSDVIRQSLAMMEEAKPVKARIRKSGENPGQPLDAV